MNIPILMYHYLGNAASADDFPYYVRQADFYNQMRFLKLGGYHAITLQQLVAARQGRQRLPARPVVITFDDGHESFASIGAPVLERFGFTATMFLITRRIDQPEYLRSTEIRELHAKGMQFESHSCTHPILTKLSSSRARAEIADSKAELEAILEAPVMFYAYRGGHYNEAIQSMVREAGYAAAVCSKPGLNRENTDLFALRRMGVRGNDNIRGFARKLTGNNATRSSVALLKHFLRVQ